MKLQHVVLLFCCSTLASSAGCGDDGGGGGDDVDATTNTCTDLTDTAPTGLLASLADMPPLTGCVEGGLGEQAEQIWFVRGETPPVSPFSYAYPVISNSCSTGLALQRMQYTWSDGTRGFGRRSADLPDGGRFATAVAMCMRTDGSMAYNSKRCFEAEGMTECRELIGVGRPYTVLGPEARNATVVGTDSFDDLAFDVDVKGDVAYVAVSSGLRAYDLSDPNGITLLGTYSNPESIAINDVEVVEVGGQRYAYISDIRTLILDVTDPRAMTAVSTIDVSGREEYSHTVQTGLRGGVPHLYLGGQEDIPVYSLAAPRAPTYVGTVPLEMKGTHDLTVDGDRLFVNNELGGFVSLGVANLEQPVASRRHNEGYYNHASAVGIVGGRRIVVEGGEGMESNGAATHLRIFDGDPASPTFMQQLGEYATRPETGIHNMIIRDGLVFIAYYQDGLRVVDIANPANPVEVAHYNSWDRTKANGGAFEGAIGIDLAADGSVILVDLNGVVRRIRVTRP